MISKDLKIEYLDRLSTPYEKNGKQECFKQQYLHGKGNELTKKFWSLTSSARLCFDLYSWMANDSNYIAIEFEKKLPGIKSGGREIHPDMDVYFEKADGIYFIESKYTEKINNKNYKKQLPEAYWNTNDTYKNSKGKDTTYPIGKRYHDIIIVMDAFLSFIEYIESIAKDQKQESWFDAKQETCHLLGIVLFAIKENPQKTIHFLNVAANYCEDPFAEKFRSKAEEMVREIFSELSIKVSFDYELTSVKDYFEKPLLSEQIGYQTEITIEDLLKDKSRYKEPILP